MKTTMPVDELGEVREELRDVAARLLSRHAGESDQGDLWAAATTAGWLGLEVAEADGGAGVTFRESCVVLEQIGAVLGADDLAVAIALGVPALAQLTGQDQRRRLLAPVLAGECRPTVALCDRHGGFDHAQLGVVAEDGRLTGIVPFVPALESADLVILPATEGGTVAWFAVLTGGAGVERAAHPAVDRTRTLGELRLADATAERLTGVPDGEAVYRWLLQRGALAAAADSLGVARTASAMAIEYAQTRRQFGRAIGSFQAIKHRCVDMFVAIEAAAVALDVAAADLPGPTGEWSEWTSIAAAQCGDTAIDVTTGGVQVLGGIGFTWDHDMHRYVKRALLNDARFGTAAWHRAELARLLAARR